jgi:hypothetical protein
MSGLFVWRQSPVQGPKQSLKRCRGRLVRALAEEALDCRFAGLPFARSDLFLNDRDSRYLVPSKGVRTSLGGKSLLHHDDDREPGGSAPATMCALIAGEPLSNAKS